MENMDKLAGEVVHLYRTKIIDEQTFRDFNFDMDSKVKLLFNQIVELEEKLKLM